MAIVRTLLGEPVEWGRGLGLLAQASAHDGLHFGDGPSTSPGLKQGSPVPSKTVCPFPVKQFRPW